MKKTIVFIVVAGLLLATFILWLLNTRMSWDLQGILMVGVGLILVASAVFTVIKRIKSAARKEPPEDELSKSVMTRASSLSYYISIYLWLFIMYISDRVKWETHTLIGTGIMGMAIIFFLSWLGVKIFGLRNG